MKTVVIRGTVPLPPPLRDVIERGSTMLVERTADEVAGVPRIDADRIVFWSASDEPELRRVAEQYASREGAGRRERVMFVSAGDAAPPAAALFQPDELFVWPRDEDRLMMAFLTSA